MDKSLIILINNLNHGVEFGLKYVVIKFPISSLCLNFLNLLYQKGFIRGFKLITNFENDLHGIIILFKFDKSGKNVINKFTLISKSGRRVYTSIKNLWQINQNSILFILLTSQGLVSDIEARSLNLGGELICSIS